MRHPSKIAALFFSLAGVLSAQAEEVSDPKVLVEITYDDCHPIPAINGYMKEAFNQTAIRTDGRIGHDNVALYADAANDTYSLVVFLDSETLVPKPTEPLACLLGPSHDYGYAAFTRSKDYRLFFQPK